MAFLAMSQTYRGEGFGRADNHDLSVSVDAQKMDVAGGSRSTDCLKVCGKRCRAAPLQIAKTARPAEKPCGSVLAR